MTPPNTTGAQALSDGSPAKRLDLLMKALEQRFPDPEPYRADPPELRLLARIDAALSSREQALSDEQENQQWKCGNEFLPYHPSASHVEPAYRDGWNACYVAAQAPAATPHASGRFRTLGVAQVRDYPALPAPRFAVNNVEKRYFTADDMQAYVDADRKAHAAFSSREQAGAVGDMDLAHEIYAMAQGPQPIEDAVQAIAQRMTDRPSGKVLPALRWTAAALQAVVASRGESGAISMIVSGEKKSLEEVLDMADAALAAPGAAVAAREKDAGDPWPTPMRQPAKKGTGYTAIISKPWGLALEKYLWTDCPADMQLLLEGRCFERHLHAVWACEDIATGKRALPSPATSGTNAALASREEAPEQSAKGLTMGGEDAK